MSLLLLAATHAAALAALHGAALVLAGARRPGEEAAEDLLPLTVIRPLKGADDGLEENLRSVLDADSNGAVRVLFALESERDPAFPAASRVAAAAPARARVVLTGPSGGRMGKAHNMIEALKSAGGDYVAFSDSDARIDRDVLIETSRAFRAGADAVCGLPDASAARRPGDVLVCLCFNHYFNVVAFLLDAFGFDRLFSGTWMAFRREALERAGGLERLERHAADDFALADALARSGADVRTLPCLVRLQESGGTIPESLRHILKWTRIVRWTVPWRYLLLPLGTPLPLLAAAVVTGDARAWSACAAAAAWRSAAAWLLDRRTARSRFPPWAYAALPLVDVAFLGLWLAGWLGRTIEWRGRRYRMRPGGLLEAAA